MSIDLEKLRCIGCKKISFTTNPETKFCAYCNKESKVTIYDSRVKVHDNRITFASRSNPNKIHYSKIIDDFN